MKRREMLVAAVAVSALKGAAQQPAEAPTDLMELARRTMKTNREAIAQVKLPMAVEPAFAFQA